jgi:hypothetical protein
MNSFLFHFLAFTLLISSTYSQNLQDILNAGECEPFDQQPLACQGILVGPWSSIWTAPSYGLSQEYFHALMNVPTPPYNIAPIDLVNGLPVECATLYLKLICPSYFRPCSVVPNSSIIPYSTLPHPVCRSVCEVCSYSLKEKKFLHSPLFFGQKKLYY